MMMIIIFLRSVNTVPIIPTTHHFFLIPVPRTENGMMLSTMC